MKINVACVVLAAGQSRRFGSNKLLHVLASGEVILRQTLQRYLQVFDSITLVVSLDHEQLKDHLADMPIRLVVCENSDAGMSQSLIAGLTENLAADATLIALADMPYVKPSSIREIVDELREDNIVQPVYQKQGGNPVGFGHQFYPDLLSIKGDQGGKQVLKDHAGVVRLLPVNDLGIHHDIDRPEQVLD